MCVCVCVCVCVWGVGWGGVRKQNLTSLVVVLFVEVNF